MLYMRAYLCILTSLSLLGRNKPPLSTLQWAAAHRGSKASKARGRRYTRSGSQRTPPSNTAIKTRVKTLEAC
jgi:hypothetical protein